MKDPGYVSHGVEDDVLGYARPPRADYRVQEVARELSVSVVPNNRRNSGVVGYS
jgi:hypothetical protein